MDDPVIRYEIDTYAPKDVLEHSREYLNEDPDTLAEVLAEFRDLIYERGECTPHRLDNDFLLRFLRARNFVVRHAHRLLVNYYQFRENNPEFYQDVCFARMTAIGDANLMMTQPFCDQSGRRILIYRLGLWNPEEITVQELFQATILTLELATIEPRTQIIGGVCIFDVGGINFNQAKHLTPKIAARIIEMIAWTYPVRTEAIHIVNTSSVFKAGYSVIKPFLNTEIKKRLFFHSSDMTLLHQHIDRKYLPEYYGGTHPFYGYQEWIEYMKRNELIRKELRELGYTLEEQLFGRIK